MAERSEIDSDRFLAHLASQSILAENTTFPTESRVPIPLNQDVDQTWTSSDQSKDSSDAVEAHPKGRATIPNEIADSKLRRALNRALKAQNEANEKGVNKKTRYRLLMKAIGNYNSALHLTAQQNEGEKNAGLLEAFIHNNIGTAYAAIDRLDDAIDNFRKAIKLNPDDPIAHHNYGSVCMRSGKIDADAYHSLGVAYMLFGNTEEGVKHLKEAIDLGSKNANTYLYLAAYYRTIDEIHEADGHLEKAADLNPSININSKYADIFLYIGCFCLMNSNFEDAIMHLELAIDINPNYAIAYNNLGYAYEKSDRFEEAIECRHKAIAINPDDAVAHHNLALVYGRTRNLEAALKSSLQAIRIKPDFAKAYIVRGLTYLIKGEQDEAEEDIAVALSLDPKLDDGIFAGILRKMEEEEAPWNDLRDAFLHAQAELAQLDAEPERREGWAALFDGALEAVGRFALLRKDIRRLNRAAKHLAVEECRDVRLELGRALNEALDRLNDLAAFQSETSQQALSLEASGEEKSGFASALLRLNRSLEAVKIEDADEVLDEIQGENAIQTLRYLQTRIKTGGRTFTRDEMNER